MKFFKWKFFAVTSAVCLLPILLGLALWNKLPDEMAIHFDIYGTPDNFASKGFVVFGIPLLMVLLQGFCCFINDINSHHHGERVKFETVTKWIIPCLSIALQILTLGIGIGWKIDVQKAVALIVGVMFIVIGNYLPKFDRVKNVKMDAEKGKKVNRFIGYETVVMGILFLISIFLPPVYTVACIFLLIPYAIISIIYAIIIAKRP